MGLCTAAVAFACDCPAYGAVPPYAHTVVHPDDEPAQRRLHKTAEPIFLLSTHPARRERAGCPLICDKIKSIGVINALGERSLTEDTTPF